ncbi:MAG: DHHA1 domain-containing protein, partial [Myxococcota bacterium]
EEFKLISSGKNVYDGATGVGDWTTLTEGPSDVFVGYTTLETTTHIRKIRHLEGDRYELTLAATPFYAESGGQVADTGTLTSADGAIAFRIEDAQKVGIGRAHAARLVEGSVEHDALKHPVVAVVDAAHRARIARNHTATHLLHAALHAYVSKDATQQGSLVASERLRFDFLGNPVPGEQLLEMERWVNEQIRAARSVVVHEDVPVDVATDEMGATALFGEKYGDTVRVVDIPGASSVELCGGTHVANTQELGVFRITSESGVAAGVRRIEALTQAAALSAYERDRQLVRDIADAVRADVHHVLERVRAVEEERRELLRRVDQLTQQIAQAAAGDLVRDAADINGLKVLAEVVSVQDRDALKQYADKLREQLDEAAVLLGANLDGKPALLCMVTDAAVKAHQIKAGDLINTAAVSIGGRGGGRPTFAQAGGQDLDGLQHAIDAFEEIVRQALAGS